MSRYLSLALLGTLVGLGIPGVGAQAQDRQERREERREERRDERREERRERGWQELGCKSVGFLGDRDTIRVGRSEGRFEAIRFKVSGNAVHMMDVKVIYANGSSDDVPVREEIRAGGETRPYDLRGARERSIREIQLVYRSRPSFRGQATVCALGRD